MLSSMNGWALSDGAFSYKDFYENIVGLFDMDLAEGWSKETLAWWNR